MPADRHEHARLVLPERDWENFLQLAACEIREYGGSSMQICRRLHAMLEGLLDTLPPSQHDVVRTEIGPLQESIDREFTDPARRAIAQQPEHQGIGGRYSS
ncbi:hypothetical protein [Streptomyces sp. NPDC002463]|uniref:hypothetical protein n=1 Tax=Streptomyces sp. NPDC002463 TaxID=3364645 RepID=UPI0036D07C3B